MGHNNFGQREERTHNSSYSKGRVSCSADTFVQAESSVFRMKFSVEKPCLRKAKKRCGLFYRKRKNK